MRFQPHVEVLFFILALHRRKTRKTLSEKTALIDEEDSIREESDDEDDCDWISCKDEVEIREGIEYSYIGKIFHDKAKKEADGSPNPFATGTVVDIMRIVYEKDLYLYFRYFNHEATDGKQPTDSEEDEDKWGFTGCIEMIKKK